MAVRACPLCLTKVPPGRVAAYSDGVECPGCRASLEVSPASRMVAATLGLLGGALVWRLTRGAGGMLGWILPLVYAFLAYSLVAPLFLMATADLRVKGAASAGEPVLAAADHSHGAHH